MFHMSFSTYVVTALCLKGKNIKNTNKKVNCIVVTALCLKGKNIVCLIR